MLSDPEPVAAPAHAEHAAHPSRWRIIIALSVEYLVHTHTERKITKKGKAHHADERHSFMLGPTSPVHCLASCCGLKEGTVVTVTTTLENIRIFLVAWRPRPSPPSATAPARVPRLPWQPAVNRNLSAPCLWMASPKPPRSALRCRPRASFPPHAAARSAAVCEPLFPCHPSLMFCCLIPWCMHTMHSTHTHTHHQKSHLLWQTRWPR